MAVASRRLAGVANRFVPLGDGRAQKNFVEETLIAARAGYNIEVEPRS
jgi:hypothetical protein